MNWEIHAALYIPPYHLWSIRLDDGVAWLHNEPGVRDMCVFEAPEEEGVYIAEIDMDMLRDYREHEVMGDKYRHPEKYQLLTV